MADTSADYITSLENEVHTAVRSEFTDWQEHPLLGCGLSDFRGEPNTRATAEAMKKRIISRLVAARVVSQEDLSVRIVPVHAHQVLILINIMAAATVNNRLEVGETLAVAFTYDSLEDSVFFLPPNQLELDFRGV